MAHLYATAEYGYFYFTYFFGKVYSSCFAAS